MAKLRIAALEDYGKGPLELILTIHRGTHEIGGSCVEIRDKDSRVILDIGMPLVGRAGEKFEFRKYENFSGQRLVDAGILPDISGIYEWDTENRPVDGLLLSHAHLDHYGFLRYLRPDVCVYLGEPTKKLIELTCLFTPLVANISAHRFFKSGESFSCAAFTITPFLMDHSSFNAHAFVIESGGKTVIYSGDFRQHGRKKAVFDHFLARGPRNVDALLLEGTSLGRENEKAPTETELEKELVTLSRQTDGIILAYLSSQNIDRLVTLFRACRRSGRLFVIDFYTANVLAGLKNHGKLPYPQKTAFPEIRVFFPRYLCDRAVKQGHEKLMNRFSRYKITREEIAERPHEITMLVRPSMLIDLKRLAKLKALEGGLLIYSLWTGYMQEPATKKLLSFIEEKGMTLHVLHTSGHADIETLRKVVETLKPRQIIPIHTFHPDKYRKMIGGNIKVLSDGENLTL